MGEVAKYEKAVEGFWRIVLEESANQYAEERGTTHSNPIKVEFDQLVCRSRRRNQVVNHLPLVAFTWNLTDQVAN